jgi:single-strand DNA-binding protein
MANYNKVILMGNLVADPDIKTLPSGTLTARFRLAVNDRYRTADGELKEETLFMDIDAFGRQAEVAQEYLGKGRAVFVEGRLRQSNWETEDGQKRSAIRVSCRRFIMMGRAGGPPPETASGDKEPETDAPGVDDAADEF